MRLHQLQPFFLPSVLVALALIGLDLLRRELRTSRKRSELKWQQKRKRAVKILNPKKQVRKAS
jgi:hypothetical protein